ncbi:sulfotransferase [Pontibacter diazotrophicus]|uniref:Sulfotransferase n=1 Tax=Pontibacter diazotrophicus TaxID=1400979 RepID=A0A3D8LC14_9BACT|nr:sulfotransferase [Pontibacter diazotrophicus]RDV14873.1 sulfotransferase [Pontibacter diazotrophicus]
MNLVFIVSQPRSGSTLLQALLSNNQWIETVSEPWLLLPLLSILKPNLIEAKFDYKLATLGINEFAGKVGGRDILIEEINNFALNLYLKIQRENTKYVLDKTPRYYEILDEIVQVFPNAKILVLKRHPFAVLNSIIDTWVKENNINQLKPFERDLLYAPFLIENFSLKHSNNPNVYSVKYEDVVKDPLVRIKSIYDWLGIPFEESVLNYRGNTSYQGLMGDPKGVHQNQRPEINSLESWKKKLHDNFWGDIIKGYGFFLGEDFLENYGPYEFVGERTQRFNELLFLLGRGVGLNKTTLKDHLKYKLYKALNFDFLLN